jgi:hypothetical protein
MSVSRMFLFGIMCAPFLGACAGTRAYMVHAEAGRQACSPLEGNPDCIDGQKVEPLVYEPGVDRTSIEDLQARYESAVDAGDAAALAALFTTDAVLEAPTGVAQGRAAIAGGLAQNTSNAGVVVVGKPHLVTNAVIRVDGLKATSTASWFELDKGNPAGHAQVGRYGKYEDQFIKSGRTWLFVKRRIVVSLS